jgi:branched-chain amino acid transport system substrate-binding protein
MKINALIALAAVLCLANAETRAAEPQDIEVIQALTGQGAFLGKQEHDALQLFEKTVNKTGGIHGSTIRMNFHDDQSNPQIAVQLLNDVLASHPKLLLGSSLVATCNAMAPLVQSGPAMYCFSAGIHPAAGSYVFTAGTSTFDQAKALVRFFRMKGWTRLALATSTDATGQDADKGFAEMLAADENKDVKLVAHVHFNITDVSVSAQMEQVRAANPQAFIVWSTGSPAGTVFRGLVQAGIDLPVGTTGGNMTYAQMKQFADFLPKDLYLPSSEWVVGGDPRIPLDAGVVAKQKEYLAAFAEAGMKPDEGSILAWDPATILVDALRQLPETATAAVLRDHIVHLAGQPGAAGLYDYAKSPQRGLSLDDVLVTRWDRGGDKWTAVSQPTGTPLER